MDISVAFEKAFASAPQNMVFCPYRVCPVGAHTDHNLGLVTGFAIDKGITIAYSLSGNEEFRICSAQFDTIVRWNLETIPLSKCGDWADYLRGVCIHLRNEYNIRYGINAYISGSLPIGGLSSSAAVTLAFTNAVSNANGIKLTERQFIDAALDAERNYVGVKCGKLDQSCEVFCKKDRLLFLDTLDDSMALVNPGKSMSEFDIAVFSSGYEHRLAGSKYNMRTDELRAAAYSLLALSGSEYTRFSETNMRDVDEKTFIEYRHLLPENFAKRAEHWFGECERVKKTVKAWENGNLFEFGKIMNESGQSSINLWQTGSDELKALTSILQSTEGVYGARFSGAGFSGCCIALTDPHMRETIKNSVKEKYIGQFPESANGFSVCFCKSADSMKI